MEKMIRWKRNRKLRWVALLLGALAAMAITIASCGMYAVYKTRDVLVASGYAENWLEDVDGETVADVSYGKNDWNKLDVFFPRELAPEKSTAFVFGRMPIDLFSQIPCCRNALSSEPKKR